MSHPDPGVVQIQLSGSGPDLFKVAVFLEGVLRTGHVDAYSPTSTWPASRSSPSTARAAGS